MKQRFNLEHIDMLRIFLGWKTSCLGLCRKTMKLNRYLSSFTKTSIYPTATETQHLEKCNVMKPNQGSDLDVSDYYYEKGLRKVYPYPYQYRTHAKDRYLGLPLLDVYHKEFFLTKEYLIQAIESGMIRINDEQVGIGYFLGFGDKITHDIHRHEKPVIAGPIEILDETDDLVVVNKPSSVPCHASGGYNLNSVHSILQKDNGYSNLLTIFRLDRLTSGVLFFGKTPNIVRKMKKQGHKKAVHKEYVCRVVGKFPDGYVTVDRPLKKEWHRFTVQTISPEGKNSVTHFHRLSYNGTSSVVKCFLESGRTHQIRVHLQYLGFPILNDYFYNHPAWGPNRGKGGLLEVPWQQVCDIISKDHSERADGGDNPLYQIFQDSSVGDQVTADVIRSIAPNISDNPRLTDQDTGMCGLDESKLVLQRNCILCKKVELDPPKISLVMFLHALKYGGPDWQYETPLPDWAKPDWDREKEFALDSLGQLAD